MPELAALEPMGRRDQSDRSAKNLRRKSRMGWPAGTAINNCLRCRRPRAISYLTMKLNLAKLAELRARPRAEVEPLRGTIGRRLGEIWERPDPAQRAASAITPFEPCAGLPLLALGHATARSRWPLVAPGIIASMAAPYHQPFCPRDTIPGGIAVDIAFALRYAASAIPGFPPVLAGTLSQDEQQRLRATLAERASS